MIVSKRLTGNVVKAAGLLPWAKRLLSFANQFNLPALRKTAASGRVTVRRLGQLAIIDIQGIGGIVFSFLYLVRTSTTVMHLWFCDPEKDIVKYNRDLGMASDMLGLGINGYGTELCVVRENGLIAQAIGLQYRPDTPITGYKTVHTVVAPYRVRAHGRNSLHRFFKLQYQTDDYTEGRQLIIRKDISSGTVDTIRDLPARYMFWNNLLAVTETSISFMENVGSGLPDYFIVFADLDGIELSRTSLEALGLGAIYNFMVGAANTVAGVFYASSGGGDLEIDTWYVDVWSADGSKRQRIKVYNADPTIPNPTNFNIRCGIPFLTDTILGFICSQNLDGTPTSIIRVYARESASGTFTFVKDYEAPDLPINYYDVMLPIPIAVGLPKKQKW